MDLISQYKGLRRENYILAFGRLVTSLGSMVWPMLTLILSQKMGVGAKEISWLLAASMILMAPAVYVGGKIADHTDKKMTIIILDLISVVCYMTCAFIPMSWLSIFLMFIGALGQNMENPAYSALTADITLTADRDKAYAVQYLCANLGLVLAPTLAGLLFVHYLWVVFLLNGTSILCSTLLIFFQIKDYTPVCETTEQAAYQKERHDASIWEVLKDNKVVLAFLIVMSGYYSIYQMYTYLMPLDMAAIHGDSGALIFGSVTSINCIVVVLFTPFITRLFGSRPEPDRVITGVVLMVSGFALFTLFKGHIPMYYFSMIVLTWGEIFVLTAESAYLSRRVPSTHRGQINGVLTVIRTIMVSTIQLIAGAVYEAHGSMSAWLTVLAAGAGLILLAVVSRNRDRSEYPRLYEKNMEVQ